MGGHVGGEVAASIAIQFLEAGFNRTPTIDGLVAAVQDANRAVWEHGVERPGPARYGHHRHRRRPGGHR